jgi:hypothetical protein
MKKRLRSLVFIIILCSITKSAYADMGLPMLSVTLGVMAIGLIPIIVIEMFILQKKLKISLRQSIKTSFITNLISTIIGIPITWVLLVLLQVATGGGRGYGLETIFQKLLAITWQAPWLVPHESELYWMVPSAELFLLIPFFFASWFIEYLIARVILKKIDKKILKHSIFIANLITYLLLGLGILSWLLISIIQHPK